MFGGFQYEASRAEALIYAKVVEKMGHPYYVKHAVTGFPNWMFVAKVCTVSTSEDLKGMGGWEEC